LEELNEFKIEDDKENNIEKAEDEFGDLLFALINYARFCNINPEQALEKTNKKFINRFLFMEEALAKQGLQIKNLTLEELDKYWNEAKTNGY
jgi:XTP/dITP diphosphohydrolase